MKDYEDMTFDEKVAFHRGQIIIAIGEGKFNDAVYSALAAINSDAWRRGIEEGKRLANSLAQNQKAERRRLEAQTNVTSKDG